LTAEQTLAHPYLVDYHDPRDEPTFEVQLTSDQFLDAYSSSELEIFRWKGNIIGLRYYELFCMSGV